MDGHCRRVVVVDTCVLTFSVLEICSDRFSCFIFIIKCYSINYIGVMYNIEHTH